MRSQILVRRVCDGDSVNAPLIFALFFALLFLCVFFSIWHAWWWRCTKYFVDYRGCQIRGYCKASKAYLSNFFINTSFPIIGLYLSVCNRRFLYVWPANKLWPFHFSRKLSLAVVNAFSTEIKLFYGIFLDRLLIDIDGILVNCG